MKKLLKKLLKRPNIIKVLDTDEMGCKECYYIEKGCPRWELMHTGCIDGLYHYEEVKD